MRTLSSIALFSLHWYWRRALVVTGFRMTQKSPSKFNFRLGAVEHPKAINSLLENP
jgi:hypothetical protein